MEPGQQENEFADDMRGWAANQKISGKTVDLLIKEGFDSMEALVLIDSDDLAQTKIQRGQQKLLLKALLSLLRLFPGYGVFSNIILSTCLFLNMSVLL